MGYWETHDLVAEILGKNKNIETICQVISQLNKKRINMTHKNLNFGKVTFFYSALRNYEISQEKQLEACKGSDS